MVAMSVGSNTVNQKIYFIYSLPVSVVKIRDKNRQLDYLNYCIRLLPIANQVKIIPYLDPQSGCNIIIIVELSLTMSFHCSYKYQ